MWLTRLLFISFLSILSMALAGQNLESDSLKLSPEDAEIKKLFSKAEKIFTTNMDSAGAIFETTLELSEKAKNWNYYIQSLNVLAAKSYFQGDFDQYEQLALRAYKEGQQYLGDNEYAFGVAINNLNNLYYRRGNYDKSIKLLLESLRIKEFNKDLKTNIAVVYTNLGINYDYIGDDNKALEFYKKALELRIDTLKADHFRILNNYRNIGRAFVGLMEYDSALVYFFKGAALWDNREKLKNKRVFNSVISSLHGIGESYLFLEKYDQASRYFQKALVLQKEDKAFRKAYTYELMARIHRAEGDYEKALEDLIIANDLAAKYYNSKDYPKIARKFFATAEIYRLQEKPQEALPYYQKALQTLAPGLAIKDDLGNPPLDQLLARPDALKTLDAKAKALWQQYEQQSDTSLLTACLATYQQAASLIRDLRQGIQTGDSKNALAERSLPAYEGAIKAAVELYHKTQKKSYLETAFQLAENNKALLLLESVNEQIARGFAGLPDSLLEQESALRVDLAYYRKLTLVEQQKGEKADAAKIKQWKDQLFALQENYDRLSRRFEKEYPRFHQLKYQNEPTTLGALQKQVLKSDQALLEYFIGTDQIYLFVLTSDAAVQLYTIDRAAETLAAVEEINDFLRTPPSAGLSAAAYQSFTQTAHQLYTQLLHPALTQLPATVNRLILIPDQQLATLPFDLLLTAPAEGQEGSFSIDQLEYVLENYELSYSYSATLLGKNKEREDQVFKHDFIGFAPSFQPAIAEATRSCTSDDLYSLRCNGPEVEAISQLLGGEGRYALEAGKKQFGEEATDYRIVHFASHACIDVENPMFSKIYLTDDYLSMYDLYNSGLHSELAVLSACNTGSGKLLKGEGVMSLARGFITSGCRSTLMSLWSVDDCATSDIMTQYYTHLKSGKNKAASLQQAKLDFIQSAKRVQQHPYYWAAFVQFGDVRPMAFGGWGWGTWLLALAGLVVLLLFIQKSSFFRKLQ